MFILILIGFILLLFIVLKLRERIKINHTYRERLEKFQKKHHLSKADLNLFRDTLGEAKVAILEVERVTKHYKQLKAIEKNEAGIRSAKEIFKKMMADPQSLSHFDDFLYIKLPSLVEAVLKIEQIKEASLTTPEIKKSTKQILETVQVLSASITDDYERIIQEASEDIALSKKLVEKHDEQPEDQFL